MDTPRHLLRAGRIGAVLTGLAVLAAACTGGTTRGLTLAGSTSVQPFAERWAEAYRARHPGAPIQIQGGGSTAGIQAALSGAADIGMSSRVLTDDEATRAASIVVARDGLAIVVHPTNPITDLTLADVRAVYAAQTRTWDALGAPRAAITVITREEGSGTRASFEELVMSGGRIAARALVQDSTGAVRQMVAADPAAIGYLSLGLVDQSVKALSLAGVAPGEPAIDAGTYPLVRPFLFIVAGEPRSEARAFIDWIMGPEGRALTRQDGLIPPRS